MNNHKNRLNAGFISLDGARGRGRTGTRGKPRGILSPVRLPIPPPGHEFFLSLYL